MTHPLATDLSIENFQSIIVDSSKDKIVMVQFWAPWSEPCAEITTILEPLVREYADALLWVRVHCDEQPEIVQQFGVRGLPTVMLVKDSQPLDGFAGPQTSQQVRELLEKHLPDPTDDALQQVNEYIAAGDYQAAFPLAKELHELNPESIDIRFAFADCSIEVGQVKQAKLLLETVTLVDQDARYSALLGKIELAEQAAQSPELQALQLALQEQPDNMQIKVDLAVQLHQSHQSEEALSLLLSVLQTDLNFADAKKITLDMINALPDGDPLKSSYRRKIYSLLY